MLNDLYHVLDPVAFRIGSFAVRWYGLAYIAGFICAGLIISYIMKRWKLRFSSDAAITIMIWVIFGVLIGGRLGYVLFYGDGYYFSHPEHIIMLSEGGMSFHGGLCGALLSGIISAWRTGIPYTTLTDIGCIGGSIGLFFGRIANFINGELWGAPTTLPWGVDFGGSAGNVMRHPSQLYEATFEGLLLFCVLMVLARRLPPRPRGFFTGVFLVWYGCCRVAVEFVRQPDVQLGYLYGGWLTMGQVLSFPLIVIGIVVLVHALRAKCPQAGLPE